MAAAFPSSFETPSKPEIAEKSLNFYSLKKIHTIVNGRYLNEFISEKLYSGSDLDNKYLNLGDNIQTLGVYENENI